METLTVLLQFLSKLPDNTYFFGTYDRTQDHNVLSPIFWWREFWHFLGGMPYGFVLGWLPYGGFIAFGFTYAVQFTYEILADLPDQNGKLDFKNFVDPLAFSLGALTISIIGSYL